MNQDTSYPPPAQPTMADPAYPPPGEAANYNPPPPAYSTKALEAGMAGGMRPTPAQPQYGVGSAAYNSSANTVVITQPGAYGLVPHNMYPDSTGAIIFSCVVSWCCCCICGIVAFVFAITAGSQQTPEQAMQRLRMSRYWSLAALISGIFIWILWFILILI